MIMFIYNNHKFISILISCLNKLLDRPDTNIARTQMEIEHIYNNHLMCITIIIWLLQLYSIQNV